MKFLYDTHLRKMSNTSYCTSFSVKIIIPNFLFDLFPMYTIFGRRENILLYVEKKKRHSYAERSFQRRYINCWRNIYPCRHTNMYNVCEITYITLNFTLCFHIYKHLALYPYLLLTKMSFYQMSAHYLTDHVC